MHEFLYKYCSTSVRFCFSSSYLFVFWQWLAVLWMLIFGRVQAWLGDITQIPGDDCREIDDEMLSYYINELSRRVV